MSNGKQPPHDSEDTAFFICLYCGNQFDFIDVFNIYDTEPTPYTCECCGARYTRNFDKIFTWIQGSFESLNEVE